jgi:alpha-tubulin suppressor-like RCC1 family protein
VRTVFVACLIVVSLSGLSQLPAGASTPKSTIETFSPTSGNAGTKVTIEGTHLGGATKVTFNGTSATIVSDHAAKIKVIVPGAATTGYIVVRKSGSKAISSSEFVVLLDSSSTATAPASPSVALGTENGDNVVVSGNASRGDPTGTVTFYECGPTTSAEPCSSQANQVGSPVTLTAGSNGTSSASSVPFAPSAAGYWCFAGYYSGDSNYLASADTTATECFNAYAPLNDATSIATDGDGYCAILTSSGLDCWGYGQYGQLGDGSGLDSATPVAVEGVGGIGTLTGVTSLVSGSYGYCALLSSGGVDCWGGGNSGQLGNGTFPTSSAVPVEVEGVGGTGTLAGVTHLFGGPVGYCALLGSGGVDCWGYGPDGELGDGIFYTTGNYGSAIPVEVEGIGGTGTLGGVTSVVGGDDSYCAVLTTGGTDCWGAGAAGGLGNGSFSNSATPVAVEGVGGTGTLAETASLVSETLGYCALLSSGSVDCWGNGYYGELGNGTFYTTGNDGSATPVEVVGVGGSALLTGVTSLVSDTFGYCALLSSGGVNCWGAGGTGSLGNGSTQFNVATPVEVEGVGGSGTLAAATSLVSENTLTYCAVLTSGRVDCWGGGYFGELGNGMFYTSSPFASTTPVEVEGVGGTGILAGVTSAVDGNAAFCALLTSGGVDCWGNGQDGELGNGIFYRAGNEGSATPVEVG